MAEKIYGRNIFAEQLQKKSKGWIRWVIGIGLIIAGMFLFSNIPMVGFIMIGAGILVVFPNKWVLLILGIVFVLLMLSNSLML